MTLNNESSYNLRCFFEVKVAVCHEKGKEQLPFILVPALGVIYKSSSLISKNHEKRYLLWSVLYFLRIFSGCSVVLFRFLNLS